MTGTMTQEHIGVAAAGELPATQEGLWAEVEIKKARHMAEAVRRAHETHHANKHPGPWWQHPLHYDIRNGKILTLLADELRGDGIVVMTAMVKTMPGDPAHFWHFACEDADGYLETCRAGSTEISFWHVY